MTDLDLEIYRVRFWKYVKQQRADECWPWTGLMLHNGYGQFRIGPGKQVAHRIAYEMCIGPIPDGLVLDHKCRNRACVNPLHLEPVSNHENVIRGLGPGGRNYRATHCIRGHEFTPENTMRWGPRNRRGCRTCNRLHQRNYRLRKAARV